MRVSLEKLVVERIALRDTLALYATFQEIEDRLVEYYGPLERLDHRVTIYLHARTDPGTWRTLWRPKHTPAIWRVEVSGYQAELDQDGDAS